MFRLVFITLLFSLISAGVHAETKKDVKKSQKNATVKVLPVAPNAFEIPVDKVPENFIYARPEPTLAWVKKQISSLPKPDQFSSKEEIEAIGINGLRMFENPKYFAFKGDVGEFGSPSLCRYEYKSDKNSLELFLNSYSYDLLPGTNKKRKLLMLKQLKRDFDSYAASNAYGASVEVTSIAHKLLYLATQEYLNSISDTNNIEMTSDKIRDLQKNMGCIIVVQMAAPFVAEFSSYEAPKFDSPTEVRISGEGIIADVVQVLYYDKRTGEIIAKNDEQK